MVKNGLSETSTQGKAKTSCTGHELKEMFSVATNWLEKNAAAINSLNVFPVPDGDTGTNMLLTMRGTMEEAARIHDNSAWVIAQAMAHGALMNARGNSGVILSQILKGLADGLGKVDCFGSSEMARAFEKAAELAYKALSKPREGTMLTVSKDIGSAAGRAAVAHASDVVAFMEVVVEEAKRSVERTPELLDVLKAAGVVDAGGQGLYVLMDGALHYLRGEAEDVEILPQEFPTTLQPAFVAAKSKESERVYGYCTEFLIEGTELNPEWIRRTIEGKGNSIVVVGDDTTVKVHIHTTTPGAILEFGTSWGSLHDLKIENMDDQHEDFIQARRTPPVPAANIAVVAVVAGEGLEKVFRSLGTTAIVPGGQTMNPSTEAILRAVDLVPSNKVIVLPNNKNVVLTAQQAAKLCKKTVNILPTHTIPQGLAALVAFNCEMDLENNLAEMSEAQKGVKTIEVTRAVRAAKVGELSIKKGAFIGLVDGKIRTASNNLWQSVGSTLDVANVKKAEIITLYYGADIRPEEAESLGKTLQKEHTSLQVEVLEGAQPHYSYIISME
jgi:DAK2 domain fusion protein YloV